MLHKTEFSKDATENNIIRMTKLLAPHVQIVRLNHYCETETWDIKLAYGKTIRGISYECAVDEQLLRDRLENALRSLELL